MRGFFFWSVRMAKLSPVFNWAELINGIPATGAKVFTYAAGSSTKQNTYTDEGGLTANPNPIILDARGEPPNDIWLTEGQSYKFVFTASTDTDPPTSPIRTIDDITGVNDTGTTTSQWVDSGVTPTYVNATQFTLPGDQTTEFQVNRRIKATVTAGTVYGYISASVFGALTTVTVVLDSGALDSGLSAVQLGLITPTNTSLPKIPDFVNSEMLAADAVTARALADSALGYALINGTITASVGASALTIAIKTKAGNDPSASDPVLVRFRNSTLATGDYVIRSITSATSIVVSSGSTLGTTSAVQSQINVLVIDNAGTVELAVVNNAGYLNLAETDLITTTAEGGAGGADSINTIYSTASRASVPYRNVAYIVSTQATAGTWASSPTQVQLVSFQNSRSQVVTGTSQATTSGTNIDFTGLPSWLNVLVVTVSVISNNGTSSFLLQFGDSGGLETTGYLGSSVHAGNAVASVGASFTTGFGIFSANAASVISGGFTFVRHSGDTWVCMGSFGFSNSAFAGAVGMTKTLTATLDRFRLTSVSGDTFDNGSINWMGW
jgi:hypothetical protein